MESGVGGGCDGVGEGRAPAPVSFPPPRDVVGSLA